MKKAKVSVYKLDGGGYQVSFIDESGNRKRNKFNTYREAKASAQGLEQAHLNPRSALTLGSLLTAYMAETPNSAITGRPHALKSFIKCLGGVKAGDVNKVHCALWLDKIKEEQNYASRTMLQIKYVFTPFFKSLVDQQILKRNYMADVYIKKGTRTRPLTFLSEPELIQILTGLTERSPTLAHPVTYFLIHTGCKIKEALSLRWSQLDLLAYTAHFFGSPRANERTLNLSPRLVEFLKQQQQISDFVFVDEEKKPWKMKKYYKHTAKVREQIGLERHWDNFTFRHTFAYHFLRKGRTLQELQVIIGHRYIEDTIKAYGNIISKDEEKLSPY